MLINITPEAGDSIVERRNIAANSPGEYHCCRPAVLKEAGRLVELKADSVAFDPAGARHGRLPFLL